VQNSVLAAQSKLIDTGYDHCPKCNQKLHKRGFTQSQFHAVFTDHKVGIQKHKCTNPACDWQSTPTTTSVFGTSIHPDLAKLQSEQGALYSYREAEKNLEKLTVHRRGVNNHNQINLITNQVGAVIAQENLKPPSPEECAPSESEVIVQVDGGHLPTQEEDKRSFEALSAVIYRPESLQPLDSHHRAISSKSCVLSSRDDNLSTIKTYVLHAARKQGMTETTVVTALADGAPNCWSVIASLAPHCQQLIFILDWFHIAKKFQNVKDVGNEDYTELLAGVKWNVWHGKVGKALSDLQNLIATVTNSKKQKKLTELYDYLHRNQAYLVNYHQREQQGKVFTSQVAESHIESMINDRHKRSGKMQWTREGAHNVLQIRGKIASNEWRDGWVKPVLLALGVAA
jgi:hypothetical protein